MSLRSNLISPWWWWYGGGGGVVVVVVVVGVVELEVVQL